MRNLFISIVLLMASVTCSAFSFPDAEHTKKWQAAASDTVTELELFLSPIMPGGTWGIAPNFSNIKNMVVGELEARWNEARVTVTVSLIARYCNDVLVPTDEDVVAFQNDPTPVPHWKEILADLRCRAFYRYRDELCAKYHVLAPPPNHLQGVHKNPLADDIDKSE